MERRSQRYDDKIEQEISKKTRTQKNEYLYDEINNKIGYEQIINLDDQTKLELSEITNNEEIKKNPYVLEKEEIKLPEEEKKVYDINSVLEEAKKNRIKYDELEKKRKLKENEYATVADINDIKETKELEIDEKELTDLINTITSHNLSDELKEALEKETDEDIFSELMGTSVDLNLEDGIAKEFTQEQDEIDDSFYTKSMDLKEQDFEISDEIDEENKSKAKIIAIIFIIILIIAVIGYFVLKYMKII